MKVSDTVARPSSRAPVASPAHTGSPSYSAQNRQVNSGSHSSARVSGHSPAMTIASPVPSPDSLRTQLNDVHDTGPAGSNTPGDT